MAALISSTLLRTQSDRRLVALAAEGSEPAFEALVERYRRPLQAYCRRLLLPAEAAEDVVQQAFLNTWQALRRGTEVQDARAWLYRVTHNAAINALKRSGYDHDELDEALHGAGAPDEDLERRIAVRQTLAGLASLPDLQREALLRTAVEGHSQEDVARALGLTGGAVRGLVYRARATLRTAATALTPAPLVQWAAAAGAADEAPLAERVAELVAGGGTVGASALLAKGGATLLAAGALAGGAVVVERETRDRGTVDRGSGQAQAADRGGSPGGSAAGGDRALAAASAARRRTDGRLLAAAGPTGEVSDGRGRGGSGDERGGSGRSGDGKGSSGGGSSGPGSGSSSGSPGPGSSSGSGSRDRDDDRSGSGSGDGDSSGSGSGDEGARVEAEHREDLDDAQSDYQDDIADADDPDDVADAEEDYADDVADAEEDHQEDLQDLEEDQQADPSGSGSSGSGSSGPG